MVSSSKPVRKLEKIQVLLLDGSTHAAGLLREVFVKLGFSNIEAVNDGYEGIQTMKRRVVHLVFTDWELRVRRRRPLADGSEAPPSDKDLLPLSGPEFVRRLRQSPRSPNPFVPVIMVINENSAERIAEARNAGVNEIVTKPLQADEVCQRIISLIDDARHFITADTYKGPCRRREVKPLPAGTVVERRVRQVRLVRRSEYQAQ